MGTFYYANGAYYHGEWKANVKDGQGRHTFEDGKVYQGRFEADHMVDYSKPEVPKDENPVCSLRLRRLEACERLRLHRHLGPGDDLEASGPQRAHQGTLHGLLAGSSGVHTGVSYIEIDDISQIHKMKCRIYIDHIIHIIDVESYVGL